MRNGFSLIELIFAIVIIAITFISIPTLMLQSSKMDELSIQQETILSISTKIKNILSYRWDENSTQGGVTRVLDIKNGNPDYIRTSSKSRSGHYIYEKRRSFFETPNYPTGVVDGLDDIDDFHKSSDNVLGGVLRSKDYKKEINLTVEVGYVDDNVCFDTTFIQKASNLKMIEVKAGKTLMRAYSANIGVRELLKRDFDEQ